MGEVMKTHYFAHDIEGDGCETALESALHILAKEILGEHKRITVPALIAPPQHALGYTPDPLLLAQAQQWSFSEAELETRLGDIVPDVILSGDNRRLFVEIFVTHSCDEAKRQKIAKRGVSTVEIDLRDLRKDGFSRESVAHRLTSSSESRNWIFHAKSEELLQKKISEILEKRADQKRMNENFRRAIRDSSPGYSTRATGGYWSERERQRQLADFERRLEETRLLRLADERNRAEGQEIQR